MRTKLIISYLLIITVALGTVLLAVNLSAGSQVKGYLRNGSLSGVDQLVQDLETYYEPTNSWEGVSEVIEADAIAQEITQAAHGFGEGGSPIMQATSQGPGNAFGPGSGPGSGKGSGQGEQLQPTATSAVVIIPLPTATPTPEPTVTETPPTATATASADILPDSLDLSIDGRSGHILTDASGVIVYSPLTDDIGKSLALSALSDAIAIVDDTDQVVGYLLPAGGSPNLPNNFESQLLQRIQQATLIAALISGAIAIILALILAQVLLKPVRALTTAAEAMAGGDLDQRVRHSGHDEVATLGQTFNQMASSLQAAETQRRSMTSDIAHELRTPLAVQQANLEALQDGIYPLTVENLTPVIDQNRLLTRLVDDLRTLALADSGELSLNLRTVDLPELCKRVALRFEASMAEQHIHIQVIVPSAIPPIQADPERIEQILHNLLQNAQRYTPQNAVVTLSVTLNAGGVQVRVRDSGPGIPPEELDRIFERFYRVEKGRERVRGGTGLGLAIARKLAEAHGGSLTADNHPQGGAQFTLRLPVGEA